MTKKSTKTPSDFGKRIRELRMQRSLTQSDLADDLDISVNHVAWMETSENPNPTLIILKKLAIYFDTSIDKLVFGEERRHKKESK